MKNLQTQSSTQASLMSPRVNNLPLQRRSASASSNDSKSVSLQDVDHVQNLIERCLQSHMSKKEAVKTLFTQAKIEPEFTTLVWQRLEKENADFFRAYYISLNLEEQIRQFNHLIEHQYNLMLCCRFPIMVPLAPGQNGIHPMPVNNLPMRYPVLQQPSIPAAGQPHLDSIGGGISSCHVVSGLLAPSNFHPIQTNSENGALDMAPVIPPNGTMSSLFEMPVNPTSVASSGYFPLTASEISGMDTIASALDTVFTSDVASSAELQLAPDNGAGISRQLDQIQWNFSLPDLPADSSFLGDLGDLGNYPGSSFMQSDSDIFFESSYQKVIGNVDDFFVDPKPPGSHSRRGLE